MNDHLHSKIGCNNSLHMCHEKGNCFSAGLDRDEKKINNISVLTELIFWWLKKKEILKNYYFRHL